MLIEALLARVEVLLVVLVEDLEDWSWGVLRKRCCSLEAQGLVVESWEKRARKEEGEKWGEEEGLFFFFDLLFKEGIFFVFKSVNNKTFVNKKETEQEKMN